MTPPKVKKGDWIDIGTNITGYVFGIREDGSLSVGYLQNQTKAIREVVVWDGFIWQFKISGPNGSYLRGNDEAIVKRGPPRT
jgi:hypothetical protein